MNSNNNDLDSIKGLYQEVILEHNRYPRNFKEMPDSSHSCEGYNPLCGDHITVYIKKSDNLISDISFVAQSCAICKASCSIMTESVKGKTIEEFKQIFHNFHHMATSKQSNKNDTHSLGKLEIFSNINRFPTRVKCATLGWHTLNDAIEGKQKASNKPN